MDGPVRNFSLKRPVIKVNSIPVTRDNDDEEANIDEKTPLALVPPPTQSKASSITVVEKDVYSLDPIVHTHGWKPETMQAPVLLALTLASLLLAALLEILAQKSASEGALSIVPSADAIPGVVSFAYLYLPTIVAVLYSLAWNWVDLDVKRMQPWLALSRDEGATGRDSLFLDYPVDFVAFVPFKAARKRHWAVFYSGTIVVLVFWILTPMQGAVFGTSAILARHPTAMTYPQTLVDAAAQAALLDQEILNAGYAVTWLGQDYPAFTTAEYALQPFVPPADALPAGAAAAANWTGVTTKYWTELDCWPAKVRHVPGFLPSVNDFDDGRGCNASALEIHAGRATAFPYKMTYIGYQGSAWADYSLDCPTCGPRAVNEFLATWAAYNNDTAGVDITAAFCEPTYWKQQVRATVSARTQRPVDAAMTPLGPPEALPDAEFNHTAFHYLIGAGVSSVEMPRDFPFTMLLAHYFRVSTIGLQFPLTPVTALALGGQNLTVRQYASVANLRRSYGAVHKMLFSLAFQRLQTNATAQPQRQADAHGATYTVQYGVTVSRVFSALVEGVLVLVAVMTGLLLWSCRTRLSMLSADPSALGSLVRLVQEDEPVQDLFSGTGHMTGEELAAKLGGYRFKLVCGCHRSSMTESLRLVGKPDFDSDDEKTSPPKPSPVGYLAPIKPLVLRKAAGLVFGIVLLAAGAALVYLKRQEGVFGGLARPSGNPEVNQILTNYLPTAFSTLVEPLWVLLNRYLCILQPFYDLTSAQRSTRRTMETRYTALPPQLAFLRALKSKHFLLASVCVTALLANVLSVGLGALFNDLPKHITRPQDYFPRYLNQITSDGMAQFVDTVATRIPSAYSDPYYVMMANLTYGTDLPPWSNSEYRFLPVNLSRADAAADTSDALFTANTTGFGVDPGCRAIGVFPADEGVVGASNLTSSTIIEYNLYNGNVSCPTTFTPRRKTFNNTNISTLPDGVPIAAEIVDTLSGTYEATNCDETLLLGWARSTGGGSDGSRVTQTTYMACTPRLQTAPFRITFDSAGRVHAATRLADFTAAWPYEDARNMSGRNPVFTSLHYSLRNSDIPWHDAPLSYDWVNYLIALVAGSRASLDPAAPLPDAAALVPAVEGTYRFVFAMFLALNPTLFKENEDPEGTLQTGTRALEETRIFMPTAAFAVSIGIIGLYCVMAFAYYGWGVKFFLPRMPSTVGSLLAYTAPSAIVKDARLSSSSSLASLSSGHTATGAAWRRGRANGLMFGRFTGHDGRGQIGICYADRTVPLNLRNLGAGDTRPSRFRLLRRRQTSKAADVWL